MLLTQLHLLTYYTLQESYNNNNYDDQYVTLPLLGYTTTRKDVLQLLSVFGGIVCFPFLLTRAHIDLPFSSSHIDVRHIMLSLHLPIIIQIGIFIYLGLAWNYLSKVLYM